MDHEVRMGLVEISNYYNVILRILAIKKTSKMNKGHYFQASRLCKMLRETIFNRYGTTAALEPL